MDASAGRTLPRVLGPTRPSTRKNQEEHANVTAAAGNSKNGSSNHEWTEWSHSMPSYMQSTVQTDICDAWSDAINEAEAEEMARDKADSEGRDPDDAVMRLREERQARHTERVWEEIRREAARDIDQEPMLSSFLYASILSHKTFHEALSFVLSNRLADQTMLPTQLFSLFEGLFLNNPDIIRGAIADLQAVYDRDPACISYSCALLYFKGYQAIQIQRLAHALWLQGRRVMALSLQSRMSEVLGLDIHPAATFGRGILLDHGTGVVIGETAVIGNGVSIMQNVTLGGTGKEVGDRHPKIQNNVLIGAGAAILGNIVVGTGAQVVAGSLVLKPVEAHTMVAGSPARCVGQVWGNPALQMEQWSKLVFETGKADASTDKSGGVNFRGHALAEDVIFGTNSHAAASQGGEQKSASPPAPTRTVKGTSGVANVDGEVAGVSTNGTGYGNGKPAARLESSPESQRRAESVRTNRGVLESISAAENRARDARIEQKRDFLKRTTAPRGNPASSASSVPPSTSTRPQRAELPPRQHGPVAASPKVPPPQPQPAQTQPLEDKMHNAKPVTVPAVQEPSPEVMYYDI